jgi:HEPN domain-containing protein
MILIVFGKRWEGYNGGKRSESLLPKTNIPDTGEPIVRTHHWIKWADSDYLAARALLLGKLLVQGCGLANTAVEKYLKARCANLERPIPRTHDVTKLYFEVKKHGGVGFLLNETFLQFLEKAYTLRYPDDIPAGFNIAMHEMKALAELDRTVFGITNSFTFDEGVSEFVLERAKRTGDMRFFSKNVV